MPAPKKKASSRRIESDARQAAEAIASGTAYGKDDPFRSQTTTPKSYVDLTFSEEDLQVEPTLRITIEAKNGKDNRIVELRAIDVTSIAQEVQQNDGIEFKKGRDNTAFYDAMRVRLARMLGVPGVSQLRLNQIVEMANNAISPQKKTDFDSSVSSSSSETLSPDGSSETNQP